MVNTCKYTETETETETDTRRPRRVCAPWKGTCTTGAGQWCLPHVHKSQIQLHSSVRVLDATDAAPAPAPAPDMGLLNRRASCTGTTG